MNASACETLLRNCTIPKAERRILMLQDQNVDVGVKRSNPGTKDPTDDLFRRSTRRDPDPQRLRGF